MADAPDGRPRSAAEIWRLLVDPGFKAVRDHVVSCTNERSLSPAQARLLRELTGPTSQRELARRLGYDPSNITAIADALEARGLVERRTDPSDRRIRTLVRTEEGEHATAALEEGLYRPPESITDLSPSEQHMLLRLLRKVFREPCH
jgi:DNA-binding MarR family transcriptional regulator